MTSILHTGSVVWLRLTRDDVSWTGMVDGYIRAQVVYYDKPTGWQAFLGGLRVDGGPWGTDTEAQRAAEEAWRER